jgi:hypothetical protein
MNLQSKLILNQVSSDGNNTCATDMVLERRLDIKVYFVYAFNKLLLYKFILMLLYHI